MLLLDFILEIVEDYYVVRYYKYLFGFWNKMFNIGIVVIVVLFCFAIKKLYYKVVIVFWIVCYSCK